jgi:hypothetical protein
LDAPFTRIEAEPLDAPMWPIHPAVWFQPEVPPMAPAWSSLTIERHNRIPAPGLVQFDIAPLDRADEAADESDALAPAARPGLSESDLEPLGWDPRAVCGKEDRK